MGAQLNPEALDELTKDLMREAKYRYHVFLSHNGADKDWTRRLARALRENGLVVFFDEDSIKLGEDLLAAIERGLKSSRHVLLVLSPEALNSGWVALEFSASLYKDPGASERSLIPILRRDCEVPLILARLRYLDARTDDLDRQVEHLLNGIERVAIDDSKPGTAHLSIRTGGQEPRAVAAQSSRVQDLLSLGRPLSPRETSLYVERESDHAAREAVEAGDLLVISGPRRIGKTSLLLRASSVATSLGKRVAFVDLELFAGGTSAPQMYYAICRMLSEILECPEPDPERFLTRPGPELGRYLMNIPEDSALFFDEFDMLEGIGALEDFAMILRAVYSQRGLRPSAVPIIVSGLRSPEQFIQNELVSPFNLGRHVRVRAFERAESEILMRAVLPSLSPQDADHIHQLVGGQPYLLQCALYWLCKGHSVQDLERKATSDDGPFGAYLPFFLHSLSEAVMKELRLKELDAVEPETLANLELMGWVRRTEMGFKWLGQLHEAVLGSRS